VGGHQTTKSAETNPAVIPKMAAISTAYKMIFGRGIDSFKSNAVHRLNPGTASQNTGISVISRRFGA